MARSSPPHTSSSPSSTTATVSTRARPKSSSRRALGTSTSGPQPRRRYCSFAVIAITSDSRTSLSHLVHSGRLSDADDGRVATGPLHARPLLLSRGEADAVGFRLRVIPALAANATGRILALVHLPLLAIARGRPAGDPRNHQSRTDLPATGGPEIRHEQGGAGTDAQICVATIAGPARGPPRSGSTTLQRDADAGVCEIVTIRSWPQNGGGSRRGRRAHARLGHEERSAGHSSHCSIPRRMRQRPGTCLLLGNLRSPLRIPPGLCIPGKQPS
jgi:hypothetical protein